MKFAKIFVHVILAMGLVEGREMPQGMVDEMMGEFFKFVDGQIAEVDKLITTNLKSAETSSNGDLKQLMKDMKGDIGLSSPVALVSQFSDQVTRFLSLFPNQLTPHFSPLADVHNKNLESLEKLPIFKMKDKRAPGIKEQYKAKFQAYVNTLNGKSQQAAEAFYKGVGAFKQEMQQLLQSKAGGREVGTLNNNWQNALKQAKQDFGKELAEKMQEFTEGLFAGYGQPSQ